jgi:hypothetical protein
MTFGLDAPAHTTNVLTATKNRANRGLDIRNRGWSLFMASSFSFAGWALSTKLLESGK